MSDPMQNEYAEAAPLQELAAERLAAHRRRRYGFELPTTVAETRVEETAERCGLPTGATRVREAVAERYRHSVSYREFLAAEAERAVEQAKAQVEIATRNVAAVSAAQTKLLEELELWPAEAGYAATSEQQIRSAQDDKFLCANVTDSPTMTGAATMGSWPAAAKPGVGQAALYSAAKEVVMSAAAVPPVASQPGLRVRLHEPMTGSVKALPRPRRSVTSEEAAQELESLDDEIAFRAAPEFDEHLLEPVTIQPNILEFPRQLVAARRVRPRLAEGPLREVQESASQSTQLRIFEVEAAAIAVQPEMEAAVVVPEWQSVVLDVPVRETRVLPVAQAPTAKPELRHMAPIMLRAVALVVDTCWVGLTFVGAVCGAMKMMGSALPHFSAAQMASGAGAGLFVLALVYGLFFLTIAGATPGMMYAEFGLYQYDATDAKRSTLRVWMLLTLLSALPAGLGMLWPVIDPERLGWQDRVCKVYPRLV